LAIQALTPDMVDLPGIGPVEGLHTLLGWASLGFMLALSIVLMVPVAAAFSGLFLEDVAAAVEARHYPHLPPAQGAGRRAVLVETLNLLGLILLVNVIGIVFVLPFTGPFYPLAFWALNGLLLGREFFMTVALRRMPPDQAKAMRKRNFAGIWFAGTLMAMPLSVPLINLAVPVLGAATFTHFYHRLVARGR
jgi:uncharacterized protein involved in cysteine biosynthesis